MTPEEFDPKADIEELYGVYTGELKPETDVGKYAENAFTSVKLSNSRLNATIDESGYITVEYTSDLTYSMKIPPMEEEIVSGSSKASAKSDSIWMEYEEGAGYYWIRTTLPVSTTSSMDINLDLPMYEGFDSGIVSDTVQITEQIPVKLDVEIVLSMYTDANGKRQPVLSGTLKHYSDYSSYNTGGVEIPDQAIEFKFAFARSSRH